MLRVGVFLRGWRAGGGLVVGNGVVGGLVELGGGLLLGEGVERGWTGWLGLGTLEGRCEGVVGAGLGGLEGFGLLLLGCCPRIVTTGLRGGERLLLLLLLLKLVVEVILLAVGVILRIESGLLGLYPGLTEVIWLLLLELGWVEACLLGLEAVLEACLLLLKP